jgi:Ca2+-binding RTX toxin-like protein
MTIVSSRFTARSTHGFFYDYKRLAGLATITGGAGADVLTGGDGADTFVYNAVVGTSSDSARVIVAGNDNDTGQDTITDFTFTGGDADTIRVVATNVNDFVHGTNTAIGTATGGVNDGTVGSFTTRTGLIDLNGNGNFGDAGDIAITFGGATAFNEADFEARLVYNLTGTAAADTITGGAGDDIITGGAGDDIITGGAGADTITGGAGNDTMTGGAGVDTFQVAFGGEGSDTIIDFTPGNAGDVFSFTGTSDVVSTNNLDADGFLLSVGAANAVIADGITVLDNGVAAIADLANLNAAGLAAVLADSDLAGGAVAFTYEDEGDVFYIVASDGTDTGLFRVEDATAGSTTIAAADITLLVTFSGISDAGLFTAANFAGFA